MATTTELLDRIDAFERSTPDRLTYRELPIVFPQGKRAANDTDAVGPSLESIARSKPDAWEAHEAARAWRSYAFGEILAAMAMAVVGLLGEAHASYVRRREARAVRLALGELDDHALHDLGLDRSETGSLAAEVTGGAERSRMLSVLARNGFLR